MLLAAGPWVALGPPALRDSPVATWGLGLTVPLRWEFTLKKLSLRVLRALGDIQHRQLGKFQTLLALTAAAPGAQ